MEIFIRKQIKRRAFKLPVVVLVCALLVMGGGIAYKAMAEPVQATGTTVPDYVAGGSYIDYGFNVTNSGAASVYKITVSVEDITDQPDFVIAADTISCPAGWTKDAESSNSQAVCITDADPINTNLLGTGNSKLISLFATAPIPSDDIQYTWVIDTVDNAWVKSQNTETKTTVDVTAPVTTDNAVTGWGNIDMAVTLTPDDGVIGSGVINNTYFCVYEVGGTVCDPITGGTQGTSVDVICEAGSVCEKFVRYYSIDNVNNQEVVKISNVIQIDKKAPVTEIAVGNPKYGTETVYVKSTTEFTLTATDDGSGVNTTKYKIDEGAETDYTALFTIAEAGEHTISYWSIDNISNIEETKILSVFVDDAEPSVGGIMIEPLHNNGTTNYISGTSNISATVSDADGSGIVSCEYTLDGGTNWTAGIYSEIEGTCSVSDVDTSNATPINIRATDNVENVGIGSAVVVTVDTVNSVISNPAISPPSPTNDNTPTITFNVSDDGSGVNSETVKIFDGTNYHIPTCTAGACSYTFDPALADGTYTFTISVSDNVNNSASDSSLAGYVIDTVKPTTSDNAPTGWQSADVTITLTPADSTPSSVIAWTKYCTDTANTCDPTIEGTSLTISTEGTTYFRYASADSAGNVQDTVSLTVMIDKQDPTAGISGAPGSWTKETQTASVTCSDQGILSGCDTTNYKYKIYTSNPTGGCSSAVGQYTSGGSVDITQHSWVCSYAQDIAGNDDFSDVPVEFTVDQTSPTGSLTGVPANWQNSDATIGLTSDDIGGSGVANSYLDVVAFGGACTPSTSIGVVTVSEHSTVCWKVEDFAGNETIGSSEILVDKIDPTTVINSPAANSWQNANFTVGVSDSDGGGSGVNICQYMVKSNMGNSNWETTKDWTSRDCNNNTPLITVGVGMDCRVEGKDTHGRCKVHVNSTDNAGNSEETWKYFSIDWTDPSVEITSPIENDVAIGTLSITAVVSDDFTTPTCSYKFDSDATEIPISCSGDNVSVVGLTEGHHTFYFYGTDLAGNTKEVESADFIVNNDLILTVDDDKVQIPNPDFITIQEAIDAATSGDTISVAEGIYMEYLTINKQLTLQGADKATTIINGGGVDSDVVFITADGVIFSGFTIQNANGGTVAGIRMDGRTGCSISNINIQNIIGTVYAFGIYGSNMNSNTFLDITISGLTETGAAENQGAWGIWLDSSDSNTFNSITVKNNTADSDCQGIMLYNGADSNTFLNTDIAGLITTGTGYVYPVGVSVYDQSNNNIFTNTNISNIEITGADGWAAGIQDRSISSGGTTGNQYINTVISNITSTKNVCGIVVDGGSVATFNGGSVQNLVGGSGGYTYGVRIKSDGSAAIIENMTISVAGHGIYIYDSTDASLSQIHSNSITGNLYGIENTDTSILDATNNWWGASSGPSGQGNGAGDAVSTNIDFNPWYINEGKTTLSNSISLDNVYVDDDYTDSTCGNYVWNLNCFDTIQEGIDAVNVNGIVNVVAGTYDELLTINKNGLTLLGAQAGINPRPMNGGRSGAESIIRKTYTTNTPALNPIKIEANSVTINGFTISPRYEASVVNLNKDLVKQDSNNWEGTTIKYNILTATGNDIVNNCDELVQLKGVTNAVIEYNYGYHATAEESGGNAFNIADGSADSVIQFNEAHKCGDFQCSGKWGGAIYTYNSNNISVIGNKIVNGGGITFGASKDTKDADWPPMRNSEGTVKDNIVENATFGLEIFADNVTVSGNDVTGCAQYALNIIGQSVTVQDNNYNNNGTGILVEDKATVFSTGVFINTNKIYNNTFGLDNLAEAEVNATKNWWGSNSGPFHASNPFGTGNTVSDNVDFRPWCSESSCIDSDITDPTVTIISSEISPTNIPSIPIVVTFSESVNNFTVDDIVITNGTKGILSGSGDSYSFNITPTVVEGTINVDIAANIAWDLSGNYNTAAIQFSIEYDSVLPPTPAITSIATDDIINDAEKAVIMVVGTAEANSLVSVSLTSGITVTGTQQLADEATTYSISIDGTTLIDGTVNVSVTATDAADNTSDPAATVSALKDTVAPTFTIVDGTDPGPVKTDVINITITEEGSGIVESRYRFLDDSNCSENENYNNTFTSGGEFSIAGDHTDYLCVKAVDEAGNTAYQLVGQLNTDNTDPTVALLSPLAATEIIGGSTTYISWTAGDANLGDTPIKLEYTIDGNWPGHTIIEATSHNPDDKHHISKYAWTVPNITSPSCYVRITATDLAGNNLSKDIGAFTILFNNNICTQVGTTDQWICDISLNQGWNLISSPVVISRTPMSVFSAINDNIEIVKYYDAGNWKSYIPETTGVSGVDNIGTIEDGKGYWVKMKNSGNILTMTGLRNPSMGDEPTTPQDYKYSLNNDWNLIGFRSVIDKTVADYVGSYIDYTGNNHPWKFDGAGYLSLSSSDNMTPGSGYWLLK